MERCDEAEFYQDYAALAAEVARLVQERDEARRERDEAMRRSHECDHEAEAMTAERDTALRALSAIVERIEREDDPAWDSPSELDEAAAVLAAAGVLPEESK